MSMTDANEKARTDSPSQTKPTPKSTTAPASTPGGLPIIPLASMGAAGTAALVSTVGVATGGVGAAAIGAVAATAAGAAGLQRARSATAARRVARALGSAGTSVQTGTATRRTGSRTPSATALARRALGKSAGGKSGGRSGGALGRALGGAKGGSAGKGRKGLSQITGAAKRAAAKGRAGAAAVGAARAARPANPAERKAAQKTARRALKDTARARKQHAAATKRNAAALGGARGGARGRKGLLGKLTGGRKTTGRNSPNARMQRAHATNAKKAAAAKKAAGRTAARRQAADQRHAKRVMDARHRRRQAGGDRAGGKTSAMATRKKRAEKRTKNRERAALAGAGVMTAAALLGRSSNIIGRGGIAGGKKLREEARDSYTHLLGGAQLMAGLEQARLFNEEHGFDNIPTVADTLVDASTPLEFTGHTNHDEVPSMTPFNLLPESEDLLNKIRTAELPGALGAVYAFDNLPIAVDVQRKAYAVMTKMASENFPFAPVVGEALGNVHAAYNTIVDAARNVAKDTRELHKDDIDRLEQPRNGERAWDVVENGGRSTGGSGLNAYAFDLLPESEDMLAKIQMATPTGAMSVVYAFDDLHKAVKAQADAFIVMAQRSAEEMPFHPGVAKALEEVHLAYKGAIKAAEGVGPLMRRVHAHDIKRLEDPRNGEDRWDWDANE